MITMKPAANLEDGRWNSNTKRYQQTCGGYLGFNSMQVTKSNEQVRNVTKLPYF